jgi:ribosomal protein S18 acetylase RimI-like enzyme
MPPADAGDVAAMATIERPPTRSVAPAGPGAEEYSAQLHRVALPGSFFVALGPRFLACYHESFRASPHGVALTAWLDGRPVGMLVGTTGNRAHYRWVARHRGLRLTGIGVLALIRRPALLRHFLRTRAGRYVRAIGRYALRRASRTPGEAPEVDGGSPAGRKIAVLTHVAVDDAARGHGLGRELVDAFVAEAAAAGASRAELVTDADNHDNHALYRHLGWTKIEERNGRDGDRKARFVRAVA